MADALTCFAGNNACCGPAPESPSTPNIVGKTALTALADSGEIAPNDDIHVRVYADAALPNFSAYQLDTVVSGGRSGFLDLVDIEIEDRADFAFAGADDTFDAFNIDSGQMLSGLLSGDVATSPNGYLATFTYRASADARGMFVLDVLHDDGGGSQTFLVGSEHTDKIEVTRTYPAVITVVEGDSRSVRQRR